MVSLILDIFYSPLTISFVYSLEILLSDRKYTTPPKCISYKSSLTEDCSQMSLLSIIVVFVLCGYGGKEATKG